MVLYGKAYPGAMVWRTVQDDDWTDCLGTVKLPLNFRYEILTTVN